MLTSYAERLEIIVIEIRVTLSMLHMFIVFKIPCTVFFKLLFSRVILKGIPRLTSSDKNDIRSVFLILDTSLRRTIVIKISLFRH